MPGPSKRERYGKAGKALMAETAVALVSGFLPTALGVALTFLAVWYCYSKLMFHGLFEGDKGRAQAFLIALTPPLLASVIIPNVNPVLGAAISTLYWVRLWKSA